MTAKAIINKKRTVLPFTGQWVETFGCPEVGKAWFVWGGTANGKTTFMMQLGKYLSQFGTVLYNSLEEGDSASLTHVLEQEGMGDLGSRFRVVSCDIDEMLDMLREKRSPQFVMIDTLQYAEINFIKYKAIKAEFPTKTFIYLSHQEGKLPDGKTAIRIQRDCRIKVRIEGFKAFASSSYRRGEGKPYTIWEEEARKYHGE